MIWLVRCVRILVHAKDILASLDVQIRPSALLSLVQDCADAGWWMGEVGGRQGVFPDNFVKLLEVEKEVSVAALQAEESLKARRVLTALL